MEKLNTEDGQLFVKNLASFVRTHEKALANAMQMRRRSSSKSIDATSSQSQSGHVFSNRSSAASVLAAALSLGTLSLTSHSIRPAKLTLTPHHLFYLLSRFEDLAVPVGPLDIRLENITAETSSSAYVSFLSKPKRARSDRDSIHSVSSVRSVMSTMGNFWSSFGLGSSRDAISKSEKAKAALEADLKYLYSAFTKIPCLRLAPDHRARLISGYEEFPFDTAVPLHAFKNLSAMEIIDVDFRSFYGWDRLSEQLRSLTLKRAHVEDVGDLLTGIVLDDIDKRRRRSSSKSQTSPFIGWTGNQSPQVSDLANSVSAPGSPIVDPVYVPSGSSPRKAASVLGGSAEERRSHTRSGSTSPNRPASSKQVSGRRHTRGTSAKVKRSESGSSNSSETPTVYRNRSLSNLLPSSANGGGLALGPSKWRFLQHLSLTDNSLTSVSVEGLAPVANTLHSLDLSWNLFKEVPDSLASLVALRSLNLSHCMIDSLHSLSKSPLPAISSLNLRGNRLQSIAGVERLLSLERLDLRDNNITDPVEIARLTAIPYIREIWVSGNPFTKSHRGNRVTIFNLFRETPGYSEDILIDNIGPSYSERKHLIERTAEREAVPVVRPVEEIKAVTIAENTHHSRHISVTETRTAVPRRSTDNEAHEGTIGSSRRKNPHKKRVIHLTDEGSPTITTVTDNLAKNATIPQEHTDSFTQPTPDEDKPAVKTSSISTTPVKASQVSTNATSTTIAASTSASERPTGNEPIKTNKPLFPSTDGISWDVGTDIYRQRLEALKHEVGTNWLTILDDDSWANNNNNGTNSTPKGIGIHGAGSMRPSPIARNSSQMTQILAGGSGALG